MAKNMDYFVNVPCALEKKMCIVLLFGGVFYKCQLEPVG